MEGGGLLVTKVGGAAVKVVARDIAMEAKAVQRTAPTRAAQNAELVQPAGFSSKGTAQSSPKFDPEKLERIQASLKDKLEIKYDAEWLDRYGSEAQFYPGYPGHRSTIVLRPEPSRGAVIEELLHFGQWQKAQRSGVSAAEFSTPARIVQDEIAAQHQLLGLKFWTSAERGEFSKNLELWKATDTK